MESKTSFDDLPEVLVMDILSRLPVKTLIRSTSVRKVWHSIIKTASFISLHLSRSVSDPSSYYIFLTNVYSYSFVLIKDNHLLTNCSPEHFFFKFKIGPTPRKTFVGACKGLVCLTDETRDGHGIYLINPFIRKYKKLDVESSCYADLIGEMKDKNGDIRIDFGYSDIEDDYMVLRIITPDYYQEREMSLKTKPIAEIYSLKTGQWKSLDVSIKIKIPRYVSVACVLGCLYWCVEREGKKEYLLCFDLKDEVFSKIQLPTTYHKLSPTRYHHILNKNDSLVVVLYDDPEMNFSSSKTKICLLVLEKNLDGHVQWKEFFSKCSHSRLYPNDFDFDSDSEYAPDLNPLGFSVGGRLISEVYYDVNSTRKSYMVAVDLDNKNAIQKFGFKLNKHFKGGPTINNSVVAATNVLESLVLLE